MALARAMVHTMTASDKSKPTSYGHLGEMTTFWRYRGTHRGAPRHVRHRTARQLRNMSGIVQTEERVVDIVQA